MGSIERIKAVAELVKNTSQKQRNIVVVSAMAGQTNQLVALSQQLSKEPKPEAYDMLLASGEQVSCALLAIALEEMGIRALPLLGFQVGIKTDSFHSKARITKIKTEILMKCIEDGIVPIVAGFQGFNEKSSYMSLTTLGRGGSDTSAVALAIATKSERCDIYTDVDGVYSADPRIVPQAKKLAQISFEEMMELASLGAKVLHMRCVELGAKFKMPIQVLSSFRPDIPGTFIVGEDKMLESPVVSAVTADSGESLLEIRLPEKQAQFPGKIFRSLADQEINVDVIVKSAVGPDGNCSISFTIPKSDEAEALRLLKQHSATKMNLDLVKVSIVGIGMHAHSGVAATLFEVLENEGIPIYLVSTSEIKVSVMIEERHKNQAIQKIHTAFELDQLAD